MLRVQDCSNSSKDYQEQLTSKQALEAIEAIKNSRSFLLISVDKEATGVSAITITKDLYDVKVLSETAREIVAALVDSALKSIREEKSK